MIGSSRFRALALGTTALVAVIAAPAHAQSTSPTGGSVDAGTASIATAGATTAVTQTSNRAALARKLFRLKAAPV